MQSQVTVVVACAFLGSVAYLSSCSSGSSDDDGKGGSSSGGKGGSASGGKGGSASGGKGGSASGGKGGSASGGSASGGNSSSGGSSSGTGGSASGTGGAVGSGGMVGMATGGSAGAPPSTSGPGVFFSGMDMNVTKLVDADAMPGYFYVSMNAPTGIKIEPVTDAALPAGTKYAVTATLDPAMPGNFIFGWNWRQDTAEKKWNYFDSSNFAGVSFWVKAETTAPALVFTGYFQYDSKGFPPDSSFGGTCTNAATDIDPCPPASEYAAVVARKTGWTRVVQRFSYNTAGTPDLKAVSRIDLLQLRLASGGPAAKFFLTGLQLLKEADLPPLP